MQKILDTAIEYFKKDDFQNYIFQIIAAVIIGLAGYFFVKFIINLLKKILNKTHIDHTAVTFITSVTKVILYIIIIITIMSTLGINVNSILTAIGAAAITAGLALQNALSNIASGVIILMTKPFTAGDRLEVGGVLCTVKNIRIFTTTVNTLDNKVITIPNSTLTSNNIINCTMVDHRRVDLKYCISYGDDIDKVREVIISTAAKCELILKDPRPSVYVGEHLDSGLQILVRVWTVSEDYDYAYFYMQENVKKAFDKNGITIPYPHIVIKNS